MKTTRIYLFFLLIIITSSCIKSLQDEDTRYFHSENEWIYNVMKNNYLFRNDMPRNPNLSQEPNAFFNSLLSNNLDINKRKTGHYSRIEMKSDGTKAATSYAARSYGFECVYYKISDASIPRVLYVIPGSAAEKAGLKRGDYIFEIDNTPVSSENLQKLQSGRKKTLLVGENMNLKNRMITMEETVPIDNKPIYLYKVINHGSRKIAYLVYNHFTSGVGSDPTKDRRYDDELCAMSCDLAAQGINEMVLDLRYNGGGQIKCAQVLATIIAPASAMGKIFCTLKDVNNKVETYRFEHNTIRNGKNLNLKRLYVLTTEFSASASELLINSLRPYMEVVIIGDMTEGKNIGSRDFTHTNFPHVLKPIFCYVFNSQGKADYNNGFTPDYHYRDFDVLSKQYSLGDPREAMLNIALNLITGTKSTTVASPPTERLNKTFTPLTTGIVIDAQ